MKKGRKKTSIQKKAANKVFSVVQPWIVYYTEHYNDSSEKDFFTFIKAKSSNLAKTILIDKTKEDNPSVKPKAIRCYILHKNYQNHKTGQKLGIEGWGRVHDSCFPNSSNFLFKKEIPRPEGYTNRFNKTNLEHLKTIGFKKGADNWSAKYRKGTHLPLDERKGKKWTGGGWVKIDDQEIQLIESKLVGAFIIHGNNRSHAARHLNISRHKLYKLMKTIHSIDWWNENYPAPKPTPPILSTERRSSIQKIVTQRRMAEGEKFFNLTKEQEQKRDEKRRLAIREKSINYRKSLIPIIKDSLSKCNNNRTAASKSINVKPATFKKWMRMTSDYVNWQTEFPVNQ